MPRIARAVAEGVPHHVTQRGNNRQDVFFVDDDRLAYLEFLKQWAPEYGLTVYAYCLMTNHVHLVVVPQKADSLARAIARTHYDYTRYVNRLHGRSGHLWQNRFFSCILDEDHFWSAVLYAELNPVRARMKREAWRYRWSSAAAHVMGKDPTGLLEMIDWANPQDRREWKRLLASGCTQEDVERIRMATRTGRPLGSDRFISKLETALGRRLRALPVGRPRRPPKQEKKARGKR